MSPADRPHFEEIAALASLEMTRGLDRLAAGDAADLESAVACFDRARELRGRLDVSAPRARYALAACWLNRAHALVRMAPARTSDALASYDEALALLRDLPLDLDPRFRRRLAIAHQNRAVALQARQPPDVSATIAGFREAARVLEDAGARSIPDRAPLLAAVLVNLANACASDGTADHCRDAAEAASRALDLVRQAEDDAPEAAEIGLTARHLLCRIIARNLASPPAGAGVPPAVHDATDLVDDGLDLVQRWEQRGVRRYRALAADLFRFGSRVYGRYQPQFLEEFVDERTDPARSSPTYVRALE